MKYVNWRRLAQFLGLVLASSLFFMFGVAFGMNFVITKEFQLVSDILQLTPEQGTELFEALMRGAVRILSRVQ